MKLTQVEGVATTLKCGGCGIEDIGGTYAYLSAASGESRMPSIWYQSEDSLTTYCGACAAGMSYEDPTRSVTQFYADTAGTEMLPEPK